MDLGNSCINRASTYGFANTAVDQANPANESGTLNHFEVWIATACTGGLEHGVFTHNGSNSLTCQTGHNCDGADMDATSTGACNTKEAPGDFDSYEVDAGEFLGVHGDDGTFDRQNSGTGIWWASGTDQISDNNTFGFTSYGNRTASFYADDSASGGSAALTGTAISGGVLESEIVTGGETIIITLTDDTWVATVGADNPITDALIAGIDSAQSEAAGWDAEVKANMVFGDITRTSDTVVTIILAAEAAYEITANETITVTIPATALTAAEEIVADATFDVTNESAGGAVPVFWHHLNKNMGGT